MGRPLRRRCSYWHESGLEILRKPAQQVLRRMEKFRSNFVTEDDLINEAWLYSFRYGDDATLGVQAFCAKLHMKQSWIKLRYERPFAKKRIHTTPLYTIKESDDYPLVCVDGQWGIQCIDIDDFLGHTLTRNQSIVVKHMMEAESKEQVGRELGVSGAAVGQTLGRVRRRLERTPRFW